MIEIPCHNPGINCIVSEECKKCGFNPYIEKLRKERLRKNDFSVNENGFKYLKLDPETNC